MFNEVTVLNIQEERAATPDEIAELISDGLLFVNYYIEPSLDEPGRVFIALEGETVGKFLLQYDKAP